jgi:hypothetical protein
VTKANDVQSEREIQFETLLKQRDQISGDLRDLENRKADLLLEQSNIERKMKDLLVGKISRAEEVAPERPPEKVEEPEEELVEEEPVKVAKPVVFGSGKVVDINERSLPAKGPGSDRSRRVRRTPGELREEVLAVIRKKPSHRQAILDVVKCSRDRLADSLAALKHEKRISTKMEFVQEDRGGATEVFHATAKAREAKLSTAANGATH